jgi:hypothetical protein
MVYGGVKHTLVCEQQAPSYINLNRFPMRPLLKVDRYEWRAQAGVLPSWPKESMTKEQHVRPGSWDRLAFLCIYSGCISAIVDSTGTAYEQQYD